MNEITGEARALLHKERAKKKDLEDFMSFAEDCASYRICARCVSYSMERVFSFSMHYDNYKCKKCGLKVRVY